MSTNERDNHFAGFAKLLLSEIQSEYGGFVDVTPAMAQLETLIAQRAYDLTMYILQMVPQLMNVVPNAHSLPEVIAFLPDMDTWPEQGE